MRKKAREGEKVFVWDQILGCKHAGKGREGGTEGGREGGREGGSDKDILFLLTKVYQGASPGSPE
jgi:hypothetical protein